MRAFTLVCVGILLLLGPAGRAQTQAPEIPLVPGLTFVLAVHNPLPAAKPGSNIAQGDYEMVVAVAGVDGNALTLATTIDAFDEVRKPLPLKISRRISRTDLAGAREQILGFHTDDPQEMPRTTALGPSLAIMRDLQTPTNDDLSTRRAAAVLTALTRDLAIAANRLTSAGFGERRPLETNDTISGRARNRRVELVRDCSK
jgi:OmpA family